MWKLVKFQQLLVLRKGSIKNLHKTHMATVNKVLKALLRKIEDPGSPMFSQRIDPGSSADFAWRIFPWNLNKLKRMWKLIYEISLS